MPDAPDFDQLARAVVPFCLGIKTADDVAEACGLVAEQLRQVWNARGAADLATKRRWSPRQLAEIRALDR
jgi:hypothetical protein